jgi:HlyD family secretion protein
VKRPLVILVVLVAALAVWLGLRSVLSPAEDLPTTRVTSGEFVISLNVNGTVDAKRAVTLSAPRIRGLQITWLAPEGSTVEAGDPVIRFDASEQENEVTDNESNLKIQQSALDRARQEYTIQEKQLTLDLEKAKRNYDEQKHEAPRVAEEARLALELAKLNFNAKLEQLKSDVQKAEVEVQRARDKLEQARKELGLMTVTAPIPGLVVYLDIWKGGQMSKVQEGDSPWPGMGLVNLPDLSEMIVKTAVSEVDASQVDTTQAVTVTLDAFADRSYHGKVAKKSTLARKKDPGSNINVFDVEVAVLDHDEHFKPGMSASCRIIIDRIPDALSVPLEAVFEKQGRTVVYAASGDERPVEVGQKNDQAIVIKSGLSAGEEVCLVDPTLKEQEMPGERATQPELNRDRTTEKTGEGPGRSSRRQGR